MSARIYDIAENFVVVDPSMRANVEAFDESLYQRIDQNYEGFKNHQLVSCHSFDEDWSTWEIHPHGDEIVMLMSGRTTLVLRVGDEDKTLSLDKAGSYVIVPKNTWHTAKTDVATTMLFITPGQDTKNEVLD